MKMAKQVLLALVLAVAVYGAAASAAAKKANVQDSLNKVVDSYTAIHALLAADNAGGVPAISSARSAKRSFLSCATIFPRR